MNDSVVSQVVEKMGNLPPDLQQKVLNFVETLMTSDQRVTHGHDLLRFVGAIPLNDLDLMRIAIETDCDVQVWT